MMATLNIAFWNNEKEGVVRTCKLVFDPLEMRLTPWLLNNPAVGLEEFLMVFEYIELIIFLT
jgi:hypothetical protein